MSNVLDVENLNVCVFVCKILLLCFSRVRNTVYMYIPHTHLLNIMMVSGFHLFCV